MEAAGIEPVTRRKQNPQQVALLPANAWISHRVVPPLRPVSPRLVPAGGAHWGHMRPNRINEVPRRIRSRRESAAISAPQSGGGAKAGGREPVDEREAGGAEGYQYSQLCERYAQWARTLNVTMRQTHRAGEKLFLDFSGDGVYLVDAKGGQCTKAKLFPAVLGASNLTYARSARARVAT
jgi:hypothetical protein